MPAVGITDQLSIGPGQPLTIIAGPCVVEDYDSAARHAQRIQQICQEHGLPLIYKSSFDKANRTSVEAYRGPGLEEGLRILQRVKEQVGAPLLTDVHLPQQAALAAEVVDVLQVPAFLCRQTDLLQAAADTGLPVNVKKGQFLAPQDVAPIVAKLERFGCSGAMITERGSSFGYNRLVVDFCGLQELRSLGVPLVFDATHSVQRPGGLGDRTGGNRDYVPALARAAVSVGVDAVFIEVHEEPDAAPCDGPNMLALDDLSALLGALRRLHEIQSEQV